MIVPAIFQIHVQNEFGGGGGMGRLGSLEERATCRWEGWPADGRGDLHRRGVICIGEG